ncbi:MAG: MFS transporter, partial [Nitrososphaerales archaeon]
AIIPQTSSDRKRNYAFALFSTIGTLAMAVGTLMAKVPEFLRVEYGYDLVNSFQPLFMLYALIGLVTMFIYAALSKNTEVKGTTPVKKVMLSKETKSIVKKLSLLFGIDSFAGGFVIQSWVAYWFFVKFALPENEIADIFFIAGILTAVSYVLAAKIASKIGLVRTMVFTHIPANILLIPLALAPTLHIAMAIYMLRMFLAQMDVPTRQSYVVAIVKPEERVAVAGVTNLSRNIPFSASPMLVGYMFQFVSLTFPFIFSGVLKTIYDLLLYRSFKKIKPPEEQ